MKNATPMTDTESIRSDLIETLNAEAVYKKQKAQYERRVYGRFGQFIMHVLEYICILAFILWATFVLIRPYQTSSDTLIILQSNCIPTAWVN